MKLEKLEKIKFPVVTEASSSPTLYVIYNTTNSHEILMIETFLNARVGLWRKSSAIIMIALKERERWYEWNCATSYWCHIKKNDFMVFHTNFGTFMRKKEILKWKWWVEVETQIYSTKCRWFIASTRNNKNKLRNTTRER